MVALRLELIPERGSFSGEFGSSKGSLFSLSIGIGSFETGLYFWSPLSKGTCLALIGYLLVLFPLLPKLVHVSSSICFKAPRILPLFVLVVVGRGHSCLFSAFSLCPISSWTCSCHGMSFSFGVGTYFGVDIFLLILLFPPSWGLSPLIFSVVCRFLVIVVQASNMVAGLFGGFFMDSLDWSMVLSLSFIIWIILTFLRVLVFESNLM